MTKKRHSDVVSIGRIDTVATSILVLDTLGNLRDPHAARSMGRTTWFARARGLMLP